jgi:anti-sigma B factor antagonist
MELSTSDHASDGSSAPPYGAEVTLIERGTTVRIVASGEIDLATAPRLRAALSFAPDATPELIELDLSAVTFIDSSGLHVLLDTVKDGGERVRIIPSDCCLRLFEVAGLIDQLPISADRQDGSVSGH